MKKSRFLALLVTVIALASLFVACPEPPEPKPTTTVYTVTFNSNGGTTEASPATKTVTKPETYIDALPTAPTKTGFTFEGWNTKQDGNGSEFTVDTPVTKSITVYAQWEAVAEGSYVVTFQATGATTQPSPTSITVSPPATTVVTLPTAPTWTDKRFDGWWTTETTGGEEFEADTEVTGSITVYARWTTLVTYTVTFNRNNTDALGTGVTEANPTTKSVITPIASTIDALPTEPTRTGYTFSGWFTVAADTGGEAFEATTPVTGNIEVFARWTLIPANSSIVTFNKNNTDTTGASEANPTTKVVTNGGTIGVGNMPTPPTRTHYTFTAWYTTELTGGTEFTATTVVNAPITVYARWTGKTYTVTFNGNGATTQASPTTKNVVVPATTIDALPTPPQQTGYIFDSWNTAANGSGTAFVQNTPVTGNIEVFAKWNPITYTVTFNKNNADATYSGPATMNVVYPATTVVNLPAAPHLEGNEFIGWFTLANGGTQFHGGAAGTGTTVTANIEVFAHYSVITPGSHTIDFDENGGDTQPDPEQMSVNENSSLTGSGKVLPKPPTRAGYTFLMWTWTKDGDDEFTLTSVVATNITVYAKWSANSYVVTFNKNGGDTEANPTSITVTSPATNVGTLPTPPTKEGYTFTGWKTEAGGGSTFAADTNVRNLTAPIVVYAQWAVALSSNANIRAVTGSRTPTAKYGLYIGGAPAISNGTPSSGPINVAAGTGTGVTNGGPINGLIAMNKNTAAIGRAIVVITEDAKVTSVEYAVALTTTTTDAADTAAPTPFRSLARNNDNTPSELTGKRWLATVEDPYTTASGSSKLYVRITAEDGTIRVYRYQYYRQSNTSDPVRGVMTALSFNAQVVASTAWGINSGWWNRTADPDVTYGEVTLTAGGEINVTSTFTNTGTASWTSVIRVPAGTTWPFLENTELGTFVENAASAATGVSTTIALPGIQDGDYIIVRDMAVDAATPAFSNAYYAHYIFKITINEPPPPATKTVTFNRNSNAPGTVPEPVTDIVVGGNTGAIANATLTAPWDTGVTFVEWNTKADGTGSAFTAATEVNEDITVYAKWLFTPGAIEVVEDTLVHTAPVTATSKDDANAIHGTWATGNSINADGSVTFASAGGAYTGGAVRYFWPQILPSGAITDYDFVVLSYVYTQAGGGGTADMSVIQKINLTGDNYTSTPVGGGAGTVNSTFATTAGGADLPRLAIKIAGYDGAISLQRNVNGGTIKFLKATFTKGTRSTITFDVNGGDATLTSIQAVQGVAIGPLPLPGDYDGYKFTGWAEGETVYTASSVMPAKDLALKAVWIPFVEADPIAVDFSLASVAAVGATLGTVDTTSYTYTATAGYGSGATFTVAIAPGNTLGDYDKISFDVLATAGVNNATWKKCDVAAAASLTGYQNPDAGPYTNFVTTYNHASENCFDTAAGVTMVFTIDKTKAALLDGTLMMGVYIHVPSGVGYKISNFRIYQDD